MIPHIKNGIINIDKSINSLDFSEEEVLKIVSDVTSVS